MSKNNNTIIKKLFIMQIFLIVGILLSSIIRHQIMDIFPKISYIFFNEIKQQNYFQQKYIFSYLKLKKIEFSQIKVTNDSFFLDGIVFLDNPTSLKCLAPIIQYKIVWINDDQSKQITLDQNYYKLNSLIPAKSINHKIYIKITQNIITKTWTKVKNKEGKIIIFYKLIERY